MSKKALPKTPESLFDPIEYSRSSRSVSPSPYRSSRSATPKFSPLRSTRKNSTWYEKFFSSSITFYVFLFFTFFLALTIFRVKPSYCDNETYFPPDCNECPENAVCNGTKYKCKEDSIEIGDMCIKRGSPDEQIIKIIPEVLNMIENKTASTISDIKKNPSFTNFTHKQIQKAVHLSEKYEVKNDNETIKHRWSQQSFDIIVYSFFTLSLIIFSLSVFFRRRN